MPNLKNFSFLPVCLIISFLFLQVKSPLDVNAQVSSSCPQNSQSLYYGCKLETTYKSGCVGYYFKDRTNNVCSTQVGSAPGVQATQLGCRCKWTEYMYYCPEQKTYRVQYYVSDAILENNGNQCWWPRDTVVDTTTSFCTSSLANCKQCCKVGQLPSPSPTPTLACPGVKGYCLSSSKVRVFWNGVAGAYSYKVYRDGIYKANVTTNGYTDVGVSCGVQHSYNVNPFRSGGFERVCKQNYKLTCPCPTKAPLLTR